MPLSSSPACAHLSRPMLLFAGLAALAMLSGCGRSARLAQLENRAPAVHATAPLHTAPAAELREHQRTIGSVWFPALRRVDLGHNTQQQIRRELEEKTFLTELAGLLGLKAQDVARLRLTGDPTSDRVDIYDYGAPAAVSARIREATNRYCRWRAEGFTRKFILASFRDRRPGTFIADPDLRALLARDPDVPLPAPAWPFRAVGIGSSPHGGEAGTWRRVQI